MQQRAQRHWHAMPVRIADRNGPFEGHIDNISRTGARLRLHRPLPKGERLAIRLAGEGVIATVVWSKGPLAGVRFTRTLPSDRLSAILDAGAPPVRGALFSAGPPRTLPRPPAACAAAGP